VNVAPQIFGVLNVTTDSFSDGGRFFDVNAALKQGWHLHNEGADVIDLGAAASNAASAHVAPEHEIARLAPVVDGLRGKGLRLSIDSSSNLVQRQALDWGVDFLNDVGGFADSSSYDMLASASVKLVVVHSMTGPRAAARDTAPGEVRASLFRFFDRRIRDLLDAGVAQGRLIVDPGMGLFLGNGTQPSLEALLSIAEVKRTYGLPVMVCVSRKSFLGDLTGRNVASRGAASLAAEIFALEQGCDYVRTHDPGALRDACAVLAALRDARTC
jgi:dihydropteroate synthase type 2